MRKRAVFICLSVVLFICSATYAGIVVGNAGFDAVLVSSGGYTYDIAPWVTPNDNGGPAAWVSNNYYAGEPPTVPAIYCTSDNVYQKLNATFVDGSVYTFKIDTGTRSGISNPAWKIYIYDATTGTYQTPLSVSTGTIPTSGQWYPATVTYVATAAQAGHQIGIGFTGDYYVMFDNAEVGWPLKAWGPDPANGATGVETNKILSWKTGLDPNDPAKVNPAITQHFVWLSSGNPADPNLVKVATVPAVGDGASYNPGGLLRDKTYYWRIDERLTTDANVITGDVWMFKTVLSVPVIITQPAGTYVYAGEDAVFTVVAQNPFIGDSTGLSYQWYKVGTPDTAVGTDSPTLTITNAQVANEGLYYCRVKIVSNQATTDSIQARLTIKKLLGHWPFDGNANDAVGTIHGTVVGNPAWVSGISDQAIDLNPDDGVNDHVVLGTSSDLNFGTDKDFTVSLWIKTEGWTDDPAFISNKDWNSGGNTGWVIAGGASPSQTWQWNFKGSVGARVDYDPTVPVLNDGKWHHLCVAHNRTAMATFYFDGIKQAERSIATSTGTLDSGYPTVIGTDGAQGATWKAWLKGTVDDVRIYNYSLNSTETAKLYSDMAGPFCAVKPQFDFDNDCRVTVSDLAIFAGTWLRCGLYPDCITTIP